MKDLLKHHLVKGSHFFTLAWIMVICQKKYRVKFLNLNEERSSQKLVYAFKENDHPILDAFLNFVHQNRSDLY